MKKWIKGLALFLCVSMICGCSPDKTVRTDGYRYLVGVSLTNVLEPWLNNLVQVLSEKAEQEKEQISFSGTPPAAQRNRYRM